MLSLFADTGAPTARAPTQTVKVEEPGLSEIAAAEPGSEQAEDGAGSDRAEYEIVLGRRQLASVLFLAIVVLVVFSTLSYVVGKSISGRATPAASDPQVIATATVPAARATVSSPAPIAPRSLPQMAAAPVRHALPGEGPALFAEPIPHKTYIQMAAVEKGVAAIFAEGLRSHGLESFAAPGPSDRIYRVLIGPLADDAAYKRAKDVVGQIGLSTFMRRYQE